MTDSLQEIAARLMRFAAAPYHESGVAAEALKICRENQLSFAIDEFGNILVSLKRSRTVKPIVLAAHLDHPAFVIKKRLSQNSWKAEFRGGVPDEYFKPGVELRLMPGNVRAKLGKRLTKAKRAFELISTSPVSAGPCFAVWDLPEFVVSNGKIMGRSCDDLIGAATILHVLIALRRTRANVNIIGVLSRAEEVGFHGALALAASKRLPKEALLISLETSKELPPIKMGSGVILRVGDRASVFDSAGTRFLAQVATGLAKGNNTFKVQRALMSGGTCEATAYQEFGYQCAAVCVALGNYHNCAPGQKIGSEYVSLSDAANMSLLLTNCARQMKNYEKITAKLPRRLAAAARSAGRELKRKQLNF